MQNHSLEERPTTLDALKIAIDGLKLLDPDGKVSDHVIDSARILINVKPAVSPSAIIQLSEESISKRTKVENEKDFAEFNIKNMIQ